MAKDNVLWNLRAANVSMMLDALSKLDLEKVTKEEKDRVIDALEKMGLSCMDILVKYGGYSIEAGAIMGGMMKLLSDLAKDEK